MATIELIASSDFETAGTQYIARLTGRAPRVTFVREFVGSKSGKRNDYTSALVDEPGLYELQNPTRKAHKARRWVLVLEHEGELVKLRSDEGDAMAIAKRLGAGEEIGQIVAVEQQTKETGDTTEVVGLVYSIRTPGEAKRAVAAATEGAAVEAIVSALAALPAPLQRKVLAVGQATPISAHPEIRTRNPVRCLTPKSGCCIC